MCFLKTSGEDNLVQGGNFLWAEIFKITALFFCFITHRLISVNNMRSEMGLQPAKRKKASKNFPLCKRVMTFKTVTPETVWQNTGGESEVITENFALSPYVTSSWAKTAAELSAPTALFHHPNTSVGYLLMLENFYDILLNLCMTVTRTTLWLLVELKENKELYANILVPREVPHKIRNKKVWWTTLYIFPNSLLFILLCYVQEKSKISTKQPSSLDVHSLICVLEVYVSCNSSVQLLLSNSCSK